jgi:hypothetical protein
LIAEVHEVQAADDVSGADAMGLNELLKEVIQKSRTEESDDEDDTTTTDATTSNAEKIAKLGGCIPKF